MFFSSLDKNKTRHCSLMQLFFCWFFFSYLAFISVYSLSKFAWFCIFFSFKWFTNGFAKFFLEIQWLLFKEKENAIGSTFGTSYCMILNLFYEKWKMMCTQMKICVFAHVRTCFVQAHSSSFQLLFITACPPCSCEL